MTLRSVLFWTHLVVGVVTLVVIAILSGTGLVLAYQRQILEWYDTHDYRAAPPSPQTPRLTPAELVAAVHAERPDASVTDIAIHADPQAPAEVGIEVRRALFLNPYTGRVWGERTDGPRPFFRAISRWHTGLGSGRGGLGHTIAATANLAVVFMIVSGLILWWPRKISWGSVRNVLWFRRGLSAKARHFNWHHVVGLWCAIPLLVIVLGALPMSYLWASDLVFYAVGASPEPRRGGGRGGGPREATPSARPAVDMHRVSELWAGVEERNQGWRTISASLPGTANAPLEFTIELGTSQQPQKRLVLALEMQSGEVASLVTFGDRSLGARIRTYLRFAHTGEVLGVFTQTIAAVSCLAACVMAWTGLALSWRRFIQPEGGRGFRRASAPRESRRRFLPRRPRREW